MKIDDNELKRLLKEGMEYEADLIMREVESDPNIKEAIAPEDLHVNLWKQIRESEEATEKEKAEQEKEEQELIRLGKKYKKKLSRRKYIILIAAVVCALAVGSVSFGDGRNVIQQVKGMLTGKTQTNIGERAGELKTVSEEDAYEQIDETFGFYPVPMHYIPEGMKFVEVVIDEEIQSARLYYADGADKMVSYYIATSHRDASVSTDVEDDFVQQYEKEINGTKIQFQEYQVEENETCRWCINFMHQSAQYSIIMTGIEQEEVEQIAENLYFS